MIRSNPLTTVDDHVGPGHDGDTFWVRPLRGYSGSTGTGLKATFALALGDRQAVCGCMTVDPGILSSSERKAIKMTLLERLMGLYFDDPGAGERPQRSLPIDLKVDSLGKPVIHVGGVPGPSVSFSLGTEMMWAAICREGYCGIDSANPEEFREGYPFHRAFRDDEFQAILEVTGGSRKQVAALVWSAKEAAVKALGCGFHLIDPLAVRIFLLESGGAFVVNRAVMRSRFGGTCGPETEMIVPVLTFRFGNTWISSGLTDEDL